MLPLFDYDVALLALRNIISTMFIVYAMQHAPALKRKPEEFFNGDINEASWNNLIKTTLEGKDYEAHVYKVSELTD